MNKHLLQEINTVTSFQTENAPRSTQKIDQDKQHNEDTNNAGILILG